MQDPDIVSLKTQLLPPKNAPIQDRPYLATVVTKRKTPMTLNHGAPRYPTLYPSLSMLVVRPVYRNSPKGPPEPCQGYRAESYPIPAITRKLLKQHGLDLGDGTDEWRRKGNVSTKAQGMGTVEPLIGGTSLKDK